MPDLTVSLETGEGLFRTLTVSVPETQVQEEIAKRLNDLQKSKSLKVDGFRPGHIPKQVIEQRFGPSIRQETFSKVVDSTLSEAMKSKDLIPAGHPNIEFTQTLADQPFEYKATFEIYPEIALPDYQKLKLERIVSEIKEEDVNEMLEDIRKHHIEWKTVDRPAKEGDQLTVDFEGFLEEGPLENGTATDFHVEIGADRMIPGFETGLIGATTGSEVDLDLSFPEEYHHKPIAGKAVSFKVKVKSVEEPDLPELNDEFAEKLQAKSSDLAGLKAEIKSNLERELENTLKSRLKTVVMDQVLDITPIELPKALVDSEKLRIHKQTLQQFQQSTGNTELPEIPSDLFEDKARRRISLGLILAKYMETHDIKPDQDKVKETIQNMADAYQDPQQIVDYYYGNKERLQEIESMVIEEEIVSDIVNNATVTEKPLSYTEVKALAEEK